MSASNNRVASGFRQVTEDVVTLIELQLQLLSIDSRQAASRAVKAAIAGAIAGVFGLATVLIASLAAGWLIRQYGGLSVGWSLLIIAGIDLVVAAIAVGLTVMLGKRAAGFMQESSAELHENMKTIKSILLDRDAYRNQIRTQPPEPAEPQMAARRF